MLLALARSGLPCNARRTTSAAAQSRQLTFPSSGLELPPVQLPLCERDVCSEESAYAFLQCRQQCRELSEDRVRIDLDKDAPSTSDLHRELDWFLDDAVASCTEADGAAVPWRQLPTMPRAKSNRPERMRLRTSLAGLCAAWHRRVHEREPLQYLCGAAHWRDIVLAVGPGVLIPRPETEGMVDIVADALQADAEQSRALLDSTWLDLGTGSGALACALARLRQQARAVATEPWSCSGIPPVLAVDASRRALAYASTNVSRLQLQGAVDVREGNWCEFSGAAALEGQCGVVVSNPPYIPSHKLPDLQPEVSRHEPWLALDGGTDVGTESIAAVTACAARMLRKDGLLVLETEAAEQVSAVRTLLADHKSIESGASFHSVETHADCFGVDRFVSARRRA